MHNIKLFFVFFIIQIQIHAMENSQKCTLAHAPNNPDLVVLCEPQTLYLHNPSTSTCTTIPASADNTYHSCTSNNDLIVIQTTKGLNLYGKNQQVIEKKTWHQNFDKTCRNQIALFPNYNDTLAIHSIDNNTSDITHSIEIHSINSPQTITTFCEKFSKARPFCMQYDKASPAKQINKQPLIACHPHKRQVAFKLHKDTLTLHNLPPLNYTLMMYLLFCDNKIEDTIVNLLPAEIRELIFNNIIALLDIQWITKHIPLKSVKSSRIISRPCDLIEYSPDGLFIALFFHDRIIAYATDTGILSVRERSPVSRMDFASIAFYPLANHTLAILDKMGKIYHCNIAKKYGGGILSHDTNEEIHKIGKLMAFSADGKSIYITQKNTCKKITLPDDTIEKIQGLESL